jgi:CRP-like cAMP-binding protein
MGRNAKDPEVMQSLFRNMRLEEWPKKHTVFSYGDRGELFYIII